MAAKRIILNFEEKVYCDESRVWYVLDHQLTPFVRDVISDVVKNFGCCEGWNLYVNDVLAPEWTLSSVIYSENDSVKLIRSKQSIPQHAADDSNELTDSSQRVITIKETKAVEAKFVREEAANMETPSNPEEPPLKISNNFKRKFCDTTPTHKDRYTNRSKIYVSPVLPKTIPVANALKTAVQETLTFSSPVQAKSCEKTSNCKTVIDSFHKARKFQDKVTNILKKNSSNPLSSKNLPADSDSDSSMTSSSSENDSSKRATKKVKTDLQPNMTNSLSPPCTGGKILKIPIPSSSSDSESDSNEKQSIDHSTESSSDKKGRNQINAQMDTKENFDKKESSDDSSDDSSDEEKDGPTILQIQHNAINKANNHSKKSSSDSSSDTDTEGTGTKDRKSNCGIAKDNENSSDDESHKDGKSTSLAEMDSRLPPSVIGKNTAEKDYNNCANLEGTPRVSDKLAFKMLDLNESYCPVISAYKEGIITAYNSSSQSIVVRLLPQFQKAEKKNGKFEMDDGFLSDTIELNLKQLIEPKLIV